MRRSLSRDEDLRRLFRANVDAVFAMFAYNVDRATAEDLTSATFEKVLRAWHRYDATKASERVWILAIARNVLIDHYRRASHRASASLDEHPGLLDRLVDSDDFVGRTLDADELRSWVGILGEREREVLALRYGADLSAADIAELLDLTAANVHQIISRSLRKLRERATARVDPSR